MTAAADLADVPRVGDVVMCRTRPALVLAFKDGLARFPIVAWGRGCYAVVDLLEDIVAVLGSVFDLPWPEHGVDGVTATWPK